MSSMGNREASGKQRQLAAHFDLLPVIEQSLMEDKLEKTAHGWVTPFQSASGGMPGGILLLYTFPIPYIGHWRALIEFHEHSLSV